MKAIVFTQYGSPDVLQLKEVENPTPKDHEVRIKIYATAVTSSDCLVRSAKVSLTLWIPFRLAVGLTKPHCKSQRYIGRSGTILLANGGIDTDAWRGAS